MFLQKQHLRQSLLSLTEKGELHGIHQVAKQPEEFQQRDKTFTAGLRVTQQSSQAIDSLNITISKQRKTVFFIVTYLMI